MSKALRLFDDVRLPGSYTRRQLIGDVLYSSYHHRDISLLFGALGGGVTRVEDALTKAMLRAGVIGAEQQAACDARIQSAFATRAMIEDFDDWPVEEIYRHVQSLRCEVLGEKTLLSWQMMCAQSFEAPVQYGIDQREQKNALLQRVSGIIFALYDAKWLPQLRADVVAVQELGKKIYILCGEELAPQALTADLPAVFVTQEDGCDELQKEIDNGAAALFAYGEDALLHCRALRADAVVHAQPEGYYARALINALDEKSACVVYVPAHFDITDYVPLRERARLTYWQLWQLYRAYGEEVYACSVAEMYCRWPQYFINIYQNGEVCAEAQADCGLKITVPAEGDAFAQHDAAREQAAADYLNSFDNLTFSTHCFDETLTPCALPYGLEKAGNGILVHAVRVKAARNAGVLSRAEHMSLRRMFGKGQTGVFSNFLFFMTPKLSQLYNDLRSDRPAEQADVTAGHLDYKLCHEAGRRIETFPLFDKMCIAMKADGTFLFFNFLLGGGKVRVGKWEFVWQKEQVNAGFDAPVCVYTPYLSRDDRDADRKTYRKTVGEGRVNLVILQDRIHCVRLGDVVLPSAGVVVSLRADTAQTLLGSLKPLENGYYDASMLDFAVELDAPDGIDADVWRTVRWAYGGGLSLIRNGAALSDSDDLTAWFDREGWTSPLSRQTQESDLHTLSRHPRTAIGQTKNGDMVLLVFSGRTNLSRGADYNEMCYIAREIYPDIENLMNVDGGASAVLCMVHDGTVVELNCPSTSSLSCAGMARPIKTLLYIPAE